MQRIQGRKFGIAGTVLAIALGVPCASSGQQVSEPKAVSAEECSQWQWDRRLFAFAESKRLLGESLGSDELATAEKVNGIFRSWSSTFRQGRSPQAFMGFVPLTDLGKATYRGNEGGLYPGGQNVPPSDHFKSGLRLSTAIEPRDATGKKAEIGKIVLLSIGMSNTTLEFQAFQKLAAADREINPTLVIVDGAVGRQSADVIAYPFAAYWKVVDERLQKAGVTAQQVQVVWLKEAIIGPCRPFPVDAGLLRDYLEDIVHILKQRFPNLTLAYLSSRIYAGYAEVPLNPEPHAYESGFAVKWLIGDQIRGKSELNFDPQKGPVRSPWLAWGPYLWADGTKGRSQNDLVYKREDFDVDGIHPSLSGQEKVARLLLRHLKSDPTSRPWFIGRGR